MVEIIEIPYVEKWGINPSEFLAEQAKAHNLAFAVMSDDPQYWPFATLYASGKIADADEVQKEVLKVLEPHYGDLNTTSAHLQETSLTNLVDQLEGRVEKTFSDGVWQDTIWPSYSAGTPSFPLDFYLESKQNFPLVDLNFRGVTGPDKVLPYINLTAEEGKNVDYKEVLAELAETSKSFQTKPGYLMVFKLAAPLDSLALE